MSNCCSCRKYLRVNDEIWYCEVCEREHHPKCSGDASEGSGEYPHDDEYSICKKCIKKLKKELQEGSVS